MDGWTCMCVLVRVIFSVSIPVSPRQPGRYIGRSENVLFVCQKALDFASLRA